MTIKRTSLDLGLRDNLLTDDNVGNTVVVDATGTTGTIYSIDIRNLHASSETVAFKLWTEPGTPVLSTTAPDFNVWVKEGTQVAVAIPEGLAYTALSYAGTVGTETGTEGSTAPTQAFTVRIVYR